MQQWFWREKQQKCGGGGGGGGGSGGGKIKKFCGGEKVGQW